MWTEHAQVIILYHINSHQCKTVKQKLIEKKLQYKEITDVDEILKSHIFQVPTLVVEEQEYGFIQALKWLNKVGKI